MKRIERGGAVATLAVNDGGLATVIVRGVMQRPHLTSISAAAANALAAKGVRAIVHRLDTALNAYSWGQFPQTAILTPAAHSTPSAIVVTSCHLAMFVEHCDHYGRQGLLRRAFTCPEQAEAWVLRASQQLAHMRQLRADLVQS